MSAHQEILKEEQGKADNVVDDMLLTCRCIRVIARARIEGFNFLEGISRRAIIDVIISEAQTLLQYRW